MELDHDCDGLNHHVVDWLAFYDKQNSTLSEGEKTDTIQFDSAADRDGESAAIEVDDSLSRAANEPSEERIGTKDTLGPTLRKYWAREVVRLYSPRRDCDCLNINYDEELAKQVLFLPLEQFISCSVNPVQVFERLKQSDDPPQLCGRVFKSGEPTYSCRDCGLDPTCVLCVDCFKNSSHKDHRYKMSMSGGGGYCDCGDKEAWKQNPFCQFHLRGYLHAKALSDRDQKIESPDESVNWDAKDVDSDDKSSGTRVPPNTDPIERLPVDLVGRLEAVFRATIRYAYEMLTRTDFVNLPLDLQYKPNSQQRDTSLQSTSATVELEDEDFEENYVTMLFNDEFHTYEQVIQSIMRAIEGTNQAEAVAVASMVDREGRSIVRCADYAACFTVKNKIERTTSRQGNKPLKVEVMTNNVVSHQNFAMRILEWLRNIMSWCEGFRAVFSRVMLENYVNCLTSSVSTSSDPILLECVMRSDVKLWKTARNEWHQLFISGMLMDAKSKKSFASMFTRLYETLMRDFIEDDHEHSVSITSLSVQFFTVPTLANALIAETGALSVLLKAFASQCAKHKNNAGKLAFERNHAAIMAFRRAQYILFDLKYLLSVKPTEWTEDLRNSFIDGFDDLLELLCSMQGMDSVVRQVGQHVEFEAEWETAINLQIKLAPVISQFTDWCSSDERVLIRSLCAALKWLDSCTPRPVQKSSGPVTREICGHRAECIDYDVSSAPVSVHIPLSRTVAALMLHLGKYDLSYHSATFEEMNKPSLRELLEFPLRTQVMLAQFRSGMWRRNGYSLVNQVFFYQNVRLRDEMYDRDVLMLQTVACLMDPNEFLIQVLNKFGLLFWAQQDYETYPRRPEEDYVRQTISLVEEFLGLMVTVVGERYNPGVGQVTLEDKVRKEVIQWLSYEPTSHSELVKYLPKEVQNFDFSFENIINQVADFKRSTSAATTGKYELKPEYQKEFNPFFYHYSRQEQSTAEENQTRRKKQAGEPLICCPPPAPVELTGQFSPLKSLLTCDVMLHLMSLVLERTITLNTVSFSETQFEKNLHLIGLALHEDEKMTGDPRQMTFLPRAVGKKMFDALELCLDCDRISGHKDLLKWTVRKFNSLLQRFNGSSETMDWAGTGSGSISSGTTSSDTAPADNAARTERKRNSEAANARRARIMAQMATLQKNFIKEHSSFFEPEPAGESGPSATQAGGSSWSLMDIDEKDRESNKEPIAVGPSQRGKVSTIENHTCILCRDTNSPAASERCMVYSGFVQRSTVLSKNRARPLWPKSGEDSPGGTPRDESPPEMSNGLPIVPADLHFGPHISTCGHVMHADCWQNFFDIVLTKERRRPLRYGRHVSFDIDKHEFLCPLCEGLSNTVIPIVSSLNYKSDPSGRTSLSADEWLMAMRRLAERAQTVRIAEETTNRETPQQFTTRFRAQPLKESLGELDVQTSTKIFSAISEYRSQISNPLGDGSKSFSATQLEMMRLLGQAIYTIGLGVNPNPEDLRLPHMTFWGVTYTIHAIERMCRTEDKKIFADQSSRKFLCLQALVRYAGSSSAIFKRETLESHAIRLLRYLLINEQHLQSPLCCLDLDAFGLLVSLVLSTPSLYVSGSHEMDATDSTSPGGQEEETGEVINMPGQIELTPPTGNVMDEHHLHTILVFHLVQVILTSAKSIGKLERNETGESATGEFVPKAERQILSQFYGDVLQVAGISIGTVPRPEDLASFLKSRLLPFVRCAALFFSFLTDVPPPTLLKSGGESALLSSLSPMDEYKSLSSYLGLSPNLSLLLECSQLRQLGLSWARHPRIHALCTLTGEDSPAESRLTLTSVGVSGATRTDVTSIVSELPLKLIHQPHEVNRLVTLPSDYSELINWVSQFTCPNSEMDDSRMPTLCLVCGSLICSQSYCCQAEFQGQLVGGCTHHSHRCGAGTGLFLRIRDCKILLLSSKTKGCYQPPPYLDEYGETDQGLVRGNPLHLSLTSYRELHKMWLGHTIPEKIAHQLEVSSALSATNWSLL